MPTLPEAFRRLREPLPAAWNRLLAATCVVLLLFAWFAITLGEAEYRVVSPTILPSPVEVLGQVDELATERGLAGAIGVSLLRVLAGFLLAVAVGVPLGILAASYRALEAFLAPVTVSLRNVPVAALVPLTLLWFGIGESQKVLFIFLACLPFAFADAAASVLNVPERYLDTARTLGASRRQLILKVLIPLALPGIVHGFRGLLGMAFGYIMLAELVNAGNGLGFLLNQSQRRGLTEHVYLILLLIGLMAWLIDFGLRRLERRLFPYREEQK
jgi:ABC-type nitrate/sulfonate/bicarbonate transport system permease component